MALFKLALITSMLAADPQIEVSTLTGEARQGELAALDQTSLTVRTKDGDVKLPLADLLGIQFTAEPPPKTVDRGLAFLRLRDGSNFRAAKVTATGRRASFSGGRLGDFSVPRTTVESIRFDADRAVDDAWSKLRGRDKKRDLLVVKKKGDVVVLDFLEGSVLSVGADEVRFLLGEDEIPVPLKKVFGIIYADRKSSGNKPVVELQMHHVGRLLASQLEWAGPTAKATLAAGGDVEIPVEQIRALDFSLGKLRYLSQMEPRETKYTPFFDVEFKYQRDKNLDGDPLRLGSKTYARGLCIHSKTSLVYRINTDYRSFQAVVGIDHAVAKNGLGDVHLVISDRDKKKVLFEADIRGTDAPRAINLDVSQVRDLQILVDFGGDLDISDWLNLAEARVTK